ncbi:hypothetical protein P3L10_003965 [Capsicum annuum]
MASGVALAAKAIINPAIRIFSAEPLGANDAFLSKKNGRITKPIVRHLVEDIIVVDNTSDETLLRDSKSCSRTEWSYWPRCSSVR